MNKKALAFSVASILTYSVPAMPVKAVSNICTNVSESNQVNQVQTSGLISSCSIEVLSGTKQLFIVADIKAVGQMKSIGFKDISIEYSSNNSNWHKEKDINDLLKSDSSDYFLNNYTVSVKGGYYYRVTLNHYAKESGLFGSSQSVSNTSNSVWVSN